MTVTERGLIEQVRQIELNRHQQDEAIKELRQENADDRRRFESLIREQELKMARQTIEHIESRADANRKVEGFEQNVKGLEQKVKGLERELSSQKAEHKRERNMLLDELGRQQVAFTELKSRFEISEARADKLDRKYDRALALIESLSQGMNQVVEKKVH